MAGERKEEGLAGNRLAVCIKIHAFSRLASDIKIIHGGMRTGEQCTGHMFGNHAHDGWLWLQRLVPLTRLNYGTLQRHRYQKDFWNFQHWIKHGIIEELYSHVKLLF